VDAFPEKKFKGKVIAVNNVGQLLPNGDTKVFEVTIKLFGSDALLRPAMTTSNVITTDSLLDVVYIPLDAVFKNDTTKFVYIYNKKQIVRQIVDVGSENANYVVVNKGISEGQEILLNLPPNAEELPLEGIEIYEEIKERLRLAEEEAQKKREEAEKFYETDDAPKTPGIPPPQGRQQGRPPGGGRR
jgi:hypothetical protein